MKSDLGSHVLVTFQGCYHTSNSDITIAPIVNLVISADNFNLAIVAAGIANPFMGFHHNFDHSITSNLGHNSIIDVLVIHIKASNLTLTNMNH